MNLEELTFKLMGENDMRFNSKKTWVALLLMVLFIASCSTKADDSALLDALDDAEEAIEENGVPF